MIDRFLRDAYGVLEYCLEAADIHLELLDRAVSDARFVTRGVFECDIAHRSLAVLCMLCKIGCDPVHPLNSGLPGPYVSVLVTCGALVAHRFTYAPPRSTTAQDFYSPLTLERCC